MQEKKELKIALGVITNHINTYSPYMDFLENAAKHKHKIDRLIIGYSHSYDKKIVNKLKEKTHVTLVKTPGDPELKNRLEAHGVKNETINTLLYTKLLDKHGLIPYGFRRNMVLLEALFSTKPVDILFFVDTDVKPHLLTDRKNKYTEIDFIGRHLEYLKKDNVVATTSDYSGYYIIPPLEFPALKELLIGLQKETAFIYTRPFNNCIVVNPEKQQVFETNKILGGNLALNLNYINIIPPFFSTTYTMDGKLFLGRGEDTLMGREIPEKGGKIIDIDTRIFHDTYGNFPEEPNIFEQDTQMRFFYACMGWLGRNPFLNWYRCTKGEITYDEWQMLKQKQKENLAAGSRGLAGYLKNSMFEKLPEAFEAAYAQLDKMIAEYTAVIKAWDEIKKILRERGKNNENPAC